MERTSQSGRRTIHLLAFLMTLALLCSLALPALGQKRPQPINPWPDPDPDPDPGCIVLPCLPDDQPLLAPDTKGGALPEEAITSASPMPFYAVGDGKGDGSSNIYRFNYFNGQITDLTFIVEAGTYLADVAIEDGASPYGPLYAVSLDNGFYRIDVQNRITTRVGSLRHFLVSLEFCDGQLYGWGENKLVLINPSDGQWTRAFTTNHWASGDLMCSGGVLYGVARGSVNDYIVHFNRWTGQASPIGVTLPGRDFYGAEIDGSGEMWVAKGASNLLRLYHVDLATYQVTLADSQVTSYGLFGLTTYPAAW